MPQALTPLQPSWDHCDHCSAPRMSSCGYTLTTRPFYSASSPTPAYFDHTKQTRQCTDTSRHGLGFVLQHCHQDKWTLVQAGSQFLLDTESRYAITELEVLAVSWAIIKCRVFLAGLPHFTVLTDHHPLIPILNNHHLDKKENPRLQRLKTKVMGYSFTAEWVKDA